MTSKSEAKRIHPQGGACLHPDAETVDGLDYCTTCGLWRGAWGDHARVAHRWTRRPNWPPRPADQELACDHGTIVLEPRPSYCDRGRFVAKVFPAHGPACAACHVDEADCWPRYYFDEDRAKAEMEAWMAARGWKAK
jgi:hypothetical protein